MKKIHCEKFSSEYSVRRMSLDDVDIIYDLCLGNTQYYEYCTKEPSRELIESDLTITPPGIPMEQKFYVGFFGGDDLVAVMDLIDGYPDEESTFLGFFMMKKELQGTGNGSRIISGVMDYLKELGFVRCQLGIDKDNPQSNHFWKKNGFEVIRVVEQEEGTILVAERTL